MEGLDSWETEWAGFRGVGWWAIGFGVARGGGPMRGAGVCGIGGERHIGGGEACPSTFGLRLFWLPGS